MAKLTKRPIRILHVFASVNRGGAESRTMDLYRNLDREKVQFDFLVNNKEIGHYEEEIIKMGGRVFRIPRFQIFNYFSYRKAVRNFFREHQEFSVVQGHMTSSAAIYLPLAKKANVPMTIAHSRNAGVDPGLKGFLTKIMELGVSRKADYLFACSRLAGIAVFGKAAWEKGRVVFIPNAIDVRKFGYNNEIRVKLRESLGLDGKFTIGHVGRFDFQKNHDFLLKIFYEIAKNDHEAYLLLVGDGQGKAEFLQKAAQLGLSPKIICTGRVDNPHEYYQAMDYFVFPSHFEGLPGAVLEAQASGLKCLISDTIADEVKITALVSAMNINEEAKKWADYVLANKDYERKSGSFKLAKAGFDATIQAEKMQSFYLTGDKSCL
ncbi:MAG: glycosyltransferase family 1 protein [Lachnospiraceae bacterium]|nr:glycosyltransferase family 1 protein [Lachnospiraceae bacterium]